MDRPLLEVNGVWKRLCRRPERALRYALADIGRELVGRPPAEGLRDGEFWALQNVNFEIEPGEVVGVIGHNGAGKSTLINVVSGVILPTRGSVALNTSRVALIDHGGGLNPIETGRENAVTQLALHGIPESRLSEELRAVEAFAEIGDFIDAPVGTYSLGMRLRLAFSVFSRLNPDLFIIDEALGGGDDRFRSKFRTYLRAYIDGGGAMLLCSHEMLAIQSFCDRCLLLDRGRVIMSGPPALMIDSYYELSREREAERAHVERGTTAGPAEATTERCAIEAVAVVAEGGGEVRPGAAMVVEIVVAASEVIEDVACAIEIGRGEVTPLSTIVGGYAGESFTLRSPRTTLRCQIASLPLAPGDYDVRVVLSLPKAAATLAMIGYQSAPVPLVVASAVDVGSNLVRGRQNIVHIPSAWYVSPSGAGQYVE